MESYELLDKIMFAATSGERGERRLGAGDRHSKFSLRCYNVNLISRDLKPRLASLPRASNYTLVSQEDAGPRRNYRV